MGALDAHTLMSTQALEPFLRITFRCVPNVNQRQQAWRIGSSKSVYV